MLERLGTLPKTLQCDPSVVQEAMDFLAAVWSQLYHALCNHWILLTL
jgi:hypothetical protein